MKDKIALDLRQLFSAIPQLQKAIFKENGEISDAAMLRAINAMAARAGSGEHIDRDHIKVFATQLFQTMEKKLVPEGDSKFMDDPMFLLGAAFVCCATFRELPGPAFIEGKRLGVHIAILGSIAGYLAGIPTKRR